MVVMLIVLVALGTIAGLTVISVQGGSAQVSAQRFSAMALYAAESGAAVTMAWLKGQHPGPGRGFDVQLGVVLPQIPGNGVQPGVGGNLLSEDQQGWYEVMLLNNPGDPGSAASDTDSIVIIQSTGYGPSGAMRRLEWEVYLDSTGAGRKLSLVGWRDMF
jgi:hypothetical protein